MFKLTLNRESVTKIVRTFLFAFLGISVPGLLGWLHGLTEWANSQGQTPFPDARSLAFLGVSAITAGSVAILNGLVLLIEDSSGKGFLRDPAQDKRIKPKPLSEGGHLALPVNLPAYVAAIYLGAVGLIAWAVWFLISRL